MVWTGRTVVVVVVLTVGYVRGVSGVEWGDSGDSMVKGEMVVILGMSVVFVRDVVVWFGLEGRWWWWWR